jgi:hypothetical protein
MRTGSSHCGALTTGLRPGGGSLTRVGLTGRFGIAHPRNLPRPSRRISSASPVSPLETIPSDGTKERANQCIGCLIYYLDSFKGARSQQQRLHTRSCSSTVFASINSRLSTPSLNLTHTAFKIRMASSTLLSGFQSLARLVAARSSSVVAC